eukprot:COSAG04_NODE_1433_length_6791_cov_2.044082_8_plen_60_part_00
MMVSGAIVPAGGIELATEDLALQQTTNSTLVSTTTCKRYISEAVRTDDAVMSLRCSITC